jgi:hypothetical protein
VRISDGRNDPRYVSGDVNRDPNAPMAEIARGSDIANHYGHPIQTYRLMLKI